ncbi:MAG: hypothetical protein CVU61_09620 [Deltaproteobacteria bacterium HGW-Deltaproteobacteria-19]|jgi:uncharacterized protein (DUF488 family)|nr:MAG: hypothetical protein CVU61_09620 [Deltaproteobacteria bacterium HGW-Deltaproteobacteria-19]
MKVYTIGHSNHTWEEFLLLLERHRIDAVADVRSRPYSRHVPRFNKSEIQRKLQEAGIAYAFLGRELGARSENPSHYLDGRVCFERLARDESFRQGIERVLRGIETYRIALMCAEKDPLDCHRGILVARRLQERGVEVLHILADGTVEPHRETERRMLAGLGISETDIFRNREDILTDAYTRRGRQIAYQRETDNAIGGSSTHS